MQIDAVTTPGSSGGPVFNSQWKCIGLAFQGHRFQSLSEVIPATVVQRFIRDYEKNGAYTGKLLFDHHHLILSLIYSETKKKSLTKQRNKIFNLKNRENDVVTKSCQKNSKFSLKNVCSSPKICNSCTVLIFCHGLGFYSCAHIHL